MLGVMDRGQKRKGLGSKEVGSVEKRKLVGSLVAEDDFFDSGIHGREESGCHRNEVGSWVNRFVRRWCERSGLRGGVFRIGRGNVEVQGST